MTTCHTHLPDDVRLARENIEQQPKVDEAFERVLADVIDNPQKYGFMLCGRPRYTALFEPTPAFANASASRGNSASCHMRSARNAPKCIKERVEEAMLRELGVQ
jgi:hypothetical protein